MELLAGVVRGVDVTVLYDAAPFGAAVPSHENVSPDHGTGLGHVLLQLAPGHLPAQVADEHAAGLGGVI